MFPCLSDPIFSNGFIQFQTGKFCGIRIQCRLLLGVGVLVGDSFLAFFPCVNIVPDGLRSALNLPCFCVDDILQTGKNLCQAFTGFNPKFIFCGNTIRCAFKRFKQFLDIAPCVNRSLADFVQFGSDAVKNICQGSGSPRRGFNLCNLLLRFTSISAKSSRTVRGFSCVI